MYLKQHIPNAAYDPRSDVKQEWEFEEVDDLLSMEWVKRFTQPKYSKFYRLSLSHPPEWQIKQTKKKVYTLMQETDEGYSWWVIGHIFNATEELINHFPVWKARTRGESV